MNEKASPYGSWVGFLDHSRAVRALSRLLSLRAVVDALLGATARERRSPRRGLRYRISDWNGWLAHEEWKAGAKLQRLAGETEIETLVDLGANAGFFSLAVLDTLAPRLSHALLVEANRALIPRLERLVEANSLNQVRVVWGAVGTGLPAGSPVAFAVEPAHLGSHLEAVASSTVGAAPERRIEVPAVSALEAWTALAGDRAIDLLKIDIEGAEYTLLKTENTLLRQARRILIEWHHAVAPRAEGEKVLAAEGFELRELFFDRPLISQALYVKRP
ncbi:methyltransferase, FkbM family [Verrucomicrobium sp. GAS474]|uniref:FkbM family methyltransferase n=1 Tax=Verrucomicrobium sp. GAS474 TaxID=1882831 RepID=UPI00087920FA|nr:FkbM family methyltransferase [Verrucomicrobium sp. GAS474]SDU03699.1 methyltransferase, FkbM family [Verrucomicrobium sp. GAS474]